MQLSFFPSKQLDYKSLSSVEKKLVFSWQDKGLIPDWALKHFDLDQIYTKPHIAQYCLKSFLKILKQKKINLNQYLFVEPSAGKGSFFNILPYKKIGLDIDPKAKGIIKKDFLTWQPENKKYICIGNPPFGYRAWLAIKFLNHCSAFSDYVGFILPMSFQSEVRGAPKLRIKGMKLIHSEKLPNDAFENTDNQTLKMNTLWQVWEKGINKKIELRDLSPYVDLFTIDNRKERLCGQEKMKKADFFLQRTFYDKPPKIVQCFSKVKYVCGYGFILKKHKTKIKKIIQQTNWKQYSNLTTHNCHHISLFHIKKRLCDSNEL